MMNFERNLTNKPKVLVCVNKKLNGNRYMMPTILHIMSYKILKHNLLKRSNLRSVKTVLKNIGSMQPRQKKLGRNSDEEISLVVWCWRVLEIEQETAQPAMRF